MPVRIQRTLSGTYHLAIDDKEFTVRESDIRVIADQAVADGVINSRNHSRNDRHVGSPGQFVPKGRRFFTRERTGQFIGGDHYRANVYIETGIALAIAYVLEFAQFFQSEGDSALHVFGGWLFLFQAVAFLWLFHFVHTDREGWLRHVLNEEP